MEINLSQLLRASSLKEAANVVRLLEDNAEVSLDEHLASREELLENYRQRVTHLQQFQTHHAQRLQRASEEFVSALDKLPAQTMIAHARVDDPLLGGYVVWLEPTEQTIVGCLYVIGKSEVPADVWQSIWEAN